MVDFAVVPECTALVNIDIQNCFVENASDGLAAVAQINRLAAACRSAGSLVVHMRHVLEPDGSNLGLLGEFSPKIKRGLLFRGSPSAQQHPALIVDPADVVLDKPRFGAFYRTGFGARQVGKIGCWPEQEPGK